MAGADLFADIQARRSSRRSSDPEAGTICVRTTGGGGAYPSCVSDTCGTSPMSLSCIQPPAGTCSATYRLSGVMVNCSAPSLCGAGQGGCA